MKILRKALIILLVSSSFMFADEIHVTQKGETLYSISRKYQITVAELRAANNLKENDVLKAGQKLTIPSADIGTAAALSGTKAKNNSAGKVEIGPQTDTYVVQKGDTLYSLARKNGMTVAELLSINKMDSNSVLKAGQKIKIVKGSATQVTSSEPKKTTETTVTVDVNVQKEDSSSKAPDTRTYGVTKTDNSTSWPVQSPQITYINGKISGVQLACNSNETVVAVREGTVMYVGMYRGFGQVLFVQSKTGLIYAYTGLGNVSVKKGDYVTFGSNVGSAGVDSIKGTPQITFMVFQNGVAIDPAKAPRG